MVPAALTLKGEWPVANNEITSTNGGVSASVQLPDSLFSEGDDREAVIDHEQHHLDRTVEAFAELLAEFNSCEGGIRCMASMVLAGACQEATEYIRAAKQALSGDGIDESFDGVGGLGISVLVISGDFEEAFSESAEPATVNPVA